MTCRVLLSMLILGAALSMTSVVATARSFWTDANGDGLPDQGGPGTSIASGDTVLVDLWIDAEDLIWNECWLYVGWPRDCYRWIGLGFYLSGGGNLFEITYDDTVGFVGVNYTESGVDRVAWLKLRCDVAGECCVEPLIAGQWPFTITSWLEVSNQRYFFSDSDISCFTAEVPNATESRSWGQLKALYR